MTCEDCIHYFVCDVSGGEIYVNEQSIRDDCHHFMRKDNTLEVIRCKDCREKYIYGDNIMRCRLSGRNINEDDYCSKADKIVYCKDCKHLMFSDCYGECAEAHKGIVQPDDYCIYGERKDDET